MFVGGIVGELTVCFKVEVDARPEEKFATFVSANEEEVVVLGKILTGF